LIHLYPTCRKNLHNIYDGILLFSFSFSTIEGVTYVSPLIESVVRIRIPTALSQR